MRTKFRNIPRNRFFDSYIRLILILSVIFLSCLCTIIFTPSKHASASEVATSSTSTSLPKENGLIDEGRNLYVSNCQRCHQIGGVGVERFFPPLKNNEHVQNETYVKNVLKNGKTGSITVNGVQYTGVMPQFKSLKDTEVDALLAYLKADFPKSTLTINEDSSTLGILIFVIIAFFILAIAIFALRMQRKIVDAENL